jgi:hypothetical protein
MHIQSALNETKAAMLLQQQSLNIIPPIDHIQYIGKPYQKLPDEINDNNMHAAIEAHFARNGVLVTDSTRTSIKCFGRIKHQGKNYYSSHYRSTSNQRNCRSVSTCLVLMNGM